MTIYKIGIFLSRRQKDLSPQPPPRVLNILFPPSLPLSYFLSCFVLYFGTFQLRFYMIFCMIDDRKTVQIMFE